MRKNVQRPTDKAERRDSTGRSVTNKSRVDASATEFRGCLQRWYQKNGRHHLPWRCTKDPYAILVSEFMLQQTQVAAVIPYYEKWMRRFPDLSALATASENDVLHAWQGLGYYTRARNLHAAAQILVKTYRVFPRTSEAIRTLPGIGRYTANAIASFAFNLPLPVIEANTGRVVARLFNLRLPIDTGPGREQLWFYATKLLNQRNARIHNSALMDLGAMICRSKPRCHACPVQAFCRATNRSKLPIRKGKRPIKLHAEHHGFSIRNGRVLLEQAQNRWRGMWILPRLTRVPLKRKPLHVSEFPFTNHRITLMVFSTSKGKHSQDSLQRWFPVDGLPELPLPSPHRRALEKLIGHRS
jgi:A/G-specific adenine glycosylase